MQQSSTLESLTFGLSGERVRRTDNGGGEEHREEKGGDVEAHDDYRRLRVMRSVGGDLDVRTRRKEWRSNPAGSGAEEPRLFIRTPPNLHA